MTRGAVLPIESLTLRQRHRVGCRVGLACRRTVVIARRQQQLYRNGNRHSMAHDPYSFTARSRRALVITDTLDRLMAAAAIIGLRVRPKSGNRMPAAIGTPAAL